MLSADSLSIIIPNLRFVPGCSALAPLSGHSLATWMKDERKTKAQLISELNRLRQTPADLETPRAKAETPRGDVSLSEQRFRTMFENVNDAIACVDEHGTVIDVNPRLVDVFGYSAEEVVGKIFTEFPFADPAVREQIVQAFAEALSGTMHELFTFQGRRKDGVPVYVEASTRPIRLEDGATGFMTILRDITERRGFEEALRQSEQKYRELIQSTIDGLFVIDAETLAVLFANETAARMFGFDSGEIGIGVNPLDYVHPDERDRAARVILEDMLEHDLRRMEEFRAFTRDGRQIWVEVVGTRTVYEGKLAGLISVRDVTERKRAERVIRIQHDLAQALNTVTRLDEGLDVCVEAILLGAQMDAVGIYLLDEEHQTLELARHHGLSEDFVRAANRYQSDSPNYRLVMEGNPIYTTHGDLGVSLDEPRLAEGLRALAVVPLSYEHRAIGCLNVGSHTSDNVPPYAREALETIAAQMAPAIRRLNVEEALRESETRFRTIFENANDEIVHLNRNGVVVDRNQKGEDILGYTLDEVIGRSFAELPQVLPEGEMSRMAELFANAMHGIGGRGLTELEMIHKNGTPLFVEASISPLRREQELEGVLVILRDMTERKKAEEQLLQRNQQLTALNDIAQTINQSVDLDAMLTNTLDKLLQILAIRHGGVHIFDRDRECLSLRVHRGMTPERVRDYSTIPLGRGYVGQVINASSPVFLEDVAGAAETADGAALAREENLRSAAFIPLKSRSDPLGIMTVVTEGDRLFSPEERDLLATVGHQISTAIENAQLFEEASRAKALVELDRLRTALLASVSHELRTPLTSIKGLASTLTQPDIEWDRNTEKEFLKIIDRESDTLTHIVNDLMEMSQIEAGIMRMVKGQTSISAIIGQLRERLSELTKDHALEIRVPDNLPPIHADEIRVGEVITNLVANATAYSEEGSRIVLEAHSSGSEVIVSVQDEGVGIAADHIDKVFDRFYRLESGVSRRRGGTGLGLSISKSIIEEHGGEIWVESKLGQGSKFSFSLPTAAHSTRKRRRYH